MSETMSRLKKGIMPLAIAAALMLTGCGNAVTSVAAEPEQAAYTSDKDTYDVYGEKKVIYTLSDNGRVMKKYIGSLMEELCYTGQRILWGKRYIPRRVYDAVVNRYKTSPDQ